VAKGSATGADIMMVSLFESGRSAAAKRQCAEEGYRKNVCLVHTCLILKMTRFERKESLHVYMEK
jgi:hypothetical protein